MQRIYNLISNEVNPTLNFASQAALQIAEYVMSVADASHEQSIETLAADEAFALLFALTMYAEELPDKDFNRIIMVDVNSALGQTIRRDTLKIWRDYSRSAFDRPYDFVLNLNTTIERFKTIYLPKAQKALKG